MVHVLNDDRLVSYGDEMIHATKIIASCENTPTNAIEVLARLLAWKE